MHGPDAPQQTWFLDGRKLVQLPPVTWPEAPHPNGFDEMIQVGGEHFAFYMMERSSGMLRASLVSGSWDISAMTLGVPNPKIFGLDQVGRISYRGTEPGLYLEVRDPTQGARAQLFAFGSSSKIVDAPLAAPTQRDLSDPPRRCSVAERKNTGRLYARTQPGTRHPVLIRDPMEPFRVMVTDAAVMFGTHDRPCAAVLDAKLESTEESSNNPRESALLPLSDLAHSWLFRSVKGRSPERPLSQYRMMNCRFDPTAEVPESVYRVAGTRVRRRAAEF